MYLWIHCSNSSPILEFSVKFASQICHENINKPLYCTYLVDFGIDIKQILSLKVLDTLRGASSSKVNYLFNSANYPTYFTLVVIITMRMLRIMQKFDCYSKLVLWRWWTLILLSKLSLILSNSLGVIQSKTKAMVKVLFFEAKLPYSHRWNAIKESCHTTEV